MRILCFECRSTNFRQAWDWANKDKNGIPIIGYDLRIKYQVYIF